MRAILIVILTFFSISTAMSQTTSSVKTIAFYLQDRVEILDFAGPMEVFAYAGYDVYTVSLDEKPIKAQGILTVTADYTVDNAPEADIIAFFGGNSSAASQNEKVINWLSSQSPEYYFSVCTGAFVLAEAGVLDGQVATTFHSALNRLESNYPQIDVRKEVRFVDNGRVVTTAGVSAGIDGALHMVAKLQGLNAAKRTAFYMEYDKWEPGEGLILTESSPYEERVGEDFLARFVGEYEFQGGTKIPIVLNNSDLAAEINGIKHPLYHEQGLSFSTDDPEDQLTFVSDKQGRVIGYRMGDEDRLYRKVK